MTPFDTTIPRTVDAIFNSIFDDVELSQGLKQRLDARMKEVLKHAKRRRNVMTLDSKRKLLEQLGFERVQDELWRMSTKVKNSKVISDNFSGNF